jgi:hypothetical protein
MRKTILIITLTGSFFYFGCKYEDGPILSLRSAEHRFYGTHILTKYTVNNIDSLTLFNDSLPLNFNFYYCEDCGHDKCDIDGVRKDGQYAGLNFGWYLTNKNKNFEIFTSSGSWATGPFGHLKKSDWQILKLKSDDIIMKTTYNSKEYFIELK